MYAHAEKSCAVTGDADTREHEPRRPRRRRTVHAALVSAVVLVLAATTWAWRHPDRSFDAGYGIEVKRAVGQRVWTTLESGRTATPGEMTIRDIAPGMTNDGAAVVVDYAICDLDPATLAADRVSGFGYGLRDGDLDRYCRRVLPAEGASLQLGTEPGRDLLVGVTASRPGRTVIRSHHITFDEGWQRGSDNIFVGVVLNAR